jgi:hypothetical protein
MEQQREVSCEVSTEHAAYLCALQLECDGLLRQVNDSAVEDLCRQASTMLRAGAGVFMGALSCRPHEHILQASRSAHLQSP